MEADHSAATGAIVIRPARRDDGEVLLGLIEALARYERLDPPDAGARARLLNDIFGGRPRLEAWLGEVDGAAAAYALFFETYSSFLALPTLYLEDIFVLPAFRSRRVGYTMFRSLVAEAHRRGCGRMEWAVLDWNRLAIDFYQRLGATRLHEWQTFRLQRGDMERIIAAP